METGNTVLCSSRCFFAHIPYARLPTSPLAVRAIECQPPAAMLTCKQTHQCSNLRFHVRKILWFATVKQKSFFQRKVLRPYVDSYISASHRITRGKSPRTTRNWRASKFTSFQEKESRASLPGQGQKASAQELAMIAIECLQSPAAHTHYFPRPTLLPTPGEPDCEMRPPRSASHCPGPEL